MGFRGYSPPYLDRTWGTWGSYYNMPKPYFIYLRVTITFKLLLRIFSGSGSAFRLGFGKFTDGGLRVQGRVPPTRVLGGDFETCTLWNENFMDI